MQILTIVVIRCQECQAERTGTEHPTFSSGKPGVAQQGGAKSGALSGDSANGGILLGSIDRDLAAIIAAWATLPEAVRGKIVAMVRSAGSQ